MGSIVLEIMSQSDAALSELKRLVKRGTHRSVKALEEALNAFIAATNERPRSFIWLKIADQTIKTISRFCELISNS